MIKTILSGAIVLFSLSSSIYADGHTMMVEWDGTPGYLESTIMADTTETGVSDSVTHAGWLKSHSKTRLGATSTWYETLVASSSISGDEETGGLADS